MVIIRNIPEQKYFADIKPVTVTADSPDLCDSVTELAYLMLKSFTPTWVSPLRRGIFSYILVDIYVTKCRDLDAINLK